MNEAVILLVITTVGTIAALLAWTQVTMLSVAISCAIVLLALSAIIYKVYTFYNQTESRCQIDNVMASGGEVWRINVVESPGFFTMPGEQGKPRVEDVAAVEAWIADATTFVAKSYP